MKWITSAWYSYLSTGGVVDASEAAEVDSYLCPKYRPVFKFPWLKGRRFPLITEYHLGLLSLSSTYTYTHFIPWIRNQQKMKTWYECYSSCSHKAMTCPIHNQYRIHNKKEKKKSIALVLKNEVKQTIIGKKKKGQNFGDVQFSVLKWVIDDWTGRWNSRKPQDQSIPKAVRQAKNLEPQKVHQKQNRDTKPIEKAANWLDIQTWGNRESTELWK